MSVQQHNFAVPKSNESKPGLAYMAPSYQEDEISLIDLWLVLVRRKTLIAVITALITALGIVVAIIKPAAYTYTTTLEVGQGVDGPIDSPSNILIKLNETHIPLLESRYADTDQSLFGAKVELKGDDLLLIKSRAPADKEQQVRQAHEEIVAEVSKADQVKLERMRQNLTNRIEKLSQQKREVELERESIKSKINDLEINEKLLEKRLTVARERLVQRESDRNRLLESIENSKEPMTLVVINEEIWRTRNEIDRLETTLYLSLGQQRSELLNEVESKQNAVRAMELDINEIKARKQEIDSLTGARWAVKSAGPVGTSAQLIVALAVILGLMVALFGAFFMEFIAKVDERLKLEQG